MWQTLQVIIVATGTLNIFLADLEAADAIDVLKHNDESVEKPQFSVLYYLHYYLTADTKS